MTESEPLLRVKSIRVEGLFERFDHRVDLKLDERVTILHGPNGVGKTMLLRMSSALFEGRLSLFQRIPFRRFTLELTDDRQVDLTLAAPSPAKPSKAARRRHRQPPRMLSLKLIRDGREIDCYEVPANQDMATLADTIATRFPWVHRYGDETWIDERDGAVLLPAEEIFARYSDELPASLGLTRRADALLGRGLEFGRLRWVAQRRGWEIPLEKLGPERFLKRDTWLV